MKTCKPDEILNPATNRCIKIDGAAFKKIDVSSLSLSDQEKVKNFQKQCKPDQAYNPLTKRCIGKKGELYKKLVKQKVIDASPKQQNTSKKTVTKKKAATPPKPDCKNDSTFFMFTDVKDIPNNDFIKLSNGFCYSVDELSSLLDSDTFKNLNPHNQSVVLFDLDKDKDILKNHPAFYDKVQKAMIKLSKVDDKNLKLIMDHLNGLYALCKMAGKVVFDNYGSFSKQSESFNLSLETLAKFNDELAKDAKAKKVIYGLKHPKTNETVKAIIESCNKGVCIHKAGSLLLQVFMYWFMQLEKAYNLTYDVAKGKVIFTRIVDNRLYFRQVNSNEIRDTGTIYVTDLLTTPKEMKESSLLKNVDVHLKYKCEKFTKSCVNTDDLYLYTNDYDAQTWCDLKDTETIKLEGNYCFGLQYIIEYVNNKLNSSNMNNPLPAYPVNPFTNKLMAKKDLKKVKKMVLLSQTKVALPVKAFLEDESLWVDDKNKYDHYKMVDKLESHKLRYKRINLKDSQDNYVGYWVPKPTPYTPFESALRKYMQTLDNQVKRAMEKMPKEEITYEKLPKYFLYSTVTM
jgi:hypothetical protein